MAGTVHGPTAAALERLKTQLDATAVLTGAGLERYETGARHGGGRAAAVVRPADAAAVSTILAWAYHHRVRVVPQGANTGLVGASTPDGSGTTVVLSLERLRTCVIDPVDRVATVGAGLPLSALNEAAGPHGLWFPIDLSADPTLGGMVATNTGGTRMLRHGDVRRRTLGTRAVLADEAGTIVDDLRPLRKANDRLALTPLLVGSFGTLAVVVEAAVELAPRPAATAVALVGSRDGHDALALLGSLETHVGGDLSAFEVCSAAAVANGNVLAALPGVPDTPLVVLVELSSADPGAPLEERLAGAVGDRPGGIVTPAAGWAVRHHISEGNRHAGWVLAFDVSVPRTRLPELRERAAALAAASLPAARLCDFGHWGDGGVHLNFVLPAAPAEEAIARVRREVWALVAGLGGSFSAEHGLGPTNAEAYLTHIPAAVRATAAALKDRLDPRGILTPLPG